jgi:hypothetical protein
VRWLVYQHIVADQSGRIAALTGTCPGAFIVATNVQFWERVPAVAAALRQYGAGESTEDALLTRLCALWAREQAASRAPLGARAASEMIRHIRTASARASPVSMGALLDTALAEDKLGVVGPA